jgi:hypothetical protein
MKKWLGIFFLFTLMNLNACNQVHISCPGKTDNYSG